MYNVCIQISDCLKPHLSLIHFLAHQLCFCNIFARISFKYKLQLIAVSSLFCFAFLYTLSWTKDIKLPLKQTLESKNMCNHTTLSFLVFSLFVFFVFLEILCGFLVTLRNNFSLKPGIYGTVIASPFSGLVLNRT